MMTADVRSSPVRFRWSRVAWPRNTINEKKRPGAFWGDRYRATAVESGQHLLNCLIYLELNPVRAGIVDHPRKWPFCSFHEHQEQKRRYTLVDMNSLLELMDINSRDKFSDFYTDLIYRSIKKGSFLSRDSKWTEAIAVGGEAYVKGVHRKLGITSCRTKITETEHGFVLREMKNSYRCGYGP